MYSNFWSGSEDAIRVVGKNESPVIFFEPDSNIPDLQRSVAHLGFKERITAATVSCFVATSTLIKALSPLPATRQELYASLARIHEVDLGGYRIPIKDRGAVYRIVPRKVRWGVVSGG